MPPNAAREYIAPPMSIDWWIRSRCNFSCDYCWGPEPGNDHIELQPQILGELAACSATVVTYCGGEPLQHRKDELIDGLPSALRSAEILQAAGKFTILNTNGALIDPILKRYVARTGRKPPYDMYGVSIDAATDAGQREMRGRNADLQRTLDGIDTIHEWGDPIKAATMVSGVNYRGLRQLADLMRTKIKPSAGWRLYQYSHRDIGHNTGQARHLLGLPEFELAAAEAAERAAPVHVYPSTEKESEGCLIVRYNGDVLLPVEDGYQVLGNCLETPIDEIWATRHPRRESVQTYKRWIGDSVVRLSGQLLRSGESLLPPDEGYRLFKPNTIGHELDVMRSFLTSNGAGPLLRQAFLSRLPGSIPPSYTDILWRQRAQMLMSCDGTNLPHASQLVNEFSRYVSAGLPPQSAPNGPPLGWHPRTPLLENPTSIMQGPSPEHTFVDDLEVVELAEAINKALLAKGENARFPGHAGRKDDEVVAETTYTSTSREVAVLGWNVAVTIRSDRPIRPTNLRGTLIRLRLSSADQTQFASYGFEIDDSSSKMIPSLNTGLQKMLGLQSDQELTSLIEAMATHAYQDTTTADVHFHGPVALPASEISMPAVAATRRPFFNIIVSDACDHNTLGNRQQVIQDTTFDYSDGARKFQLRARIRSEPHVQALEHISLSVDGNPQLSEISFITRGQFAMISDAADNVLRTINSTTARNQWD